MKAIKKSLSLLLSFLMVISTIACAFTKLSFTAEAASSVWSGTFPTQPTGYTEANGKVTISSADGLAYFVRRIAEGVTFEGNTVSIVTNIDLSGGNFTMGSAYRDKAFKGTFNGNGHTISNMRISGSWDNVGLFMCTANSVTIKNVTFKNPKIVNSGASTAVIVGNANGSIVFNNVHIIGTPTATANGACNVNGANKQVGAFVGAGNLGNSNSSFTNCSSSASVYGGNAHVGGYWGVEASDYLIAFSGCAHTGNVTAPNGAATGGYIGATYGAVTMTNCSNTGIIAGSSEAGGLVGYLDDDPIKLTKCINTGKITSSAKQAGGLIGYCDDGASVITESYNTGAVNGKGDSGGLVGESYSTMTYTKSFNTGSVTSQSNSAGGIAGRSDSQSKFNYCYNGGYIKGVSDRAAGICAYFDGTKPDITSCYVYGGYSGASNANVFYSTNNATVTNCYCLNTVNASPLQGTAVPAATLSSEIMPDLLGGGFVQNTFGVNGGYPLQLFFYEYATKIKTSINVSQMTQAKLIAALPEAQFLNTVSIGFPNLDNSTTLAAIESRLHALLQGYFDEIFRTYDNFGCVCLNNYAKIRDLSELVYEIINSCHLAYTEAESDRMTRLYGIMDELELFKLSKGSNSYVKGEVTYPVRTVKDNDLVKDSDYVSDKEAFEDVYTKIDNMLLGEDFASILGLDSTLDGFIDSLISDNLYNDKIINLIVEMIYPMVCEMITDAIEDNGEINLGATSIDLRDEMTDIAEDLISDYGVYIYPKDLGNKLNSIDPAAYAAVIKELKAAGYNWDNVNWDNMIWNVNDMHSWIYALGSALSGATPLLRAILANYQYDHSEDALDWGIVSAELRIVVKKTRGYNNAILPILEMLIGDSDISYMYNGVTYNGMMSTTDYEKLTTSNDLIAHIMFPIFSWVENTLCKKPLATISELLANLAYELEFDSLKDWISGLNTNFRFKVDIDYLAFFSSNVVDEDMDIDLFDMLVDNSDGIMHNMDRTSVDGVANFIFNMMEQNITLPEVNNAYLASLGEMKIVNSKTAEGISYYVDADEGAVLLSILRYVCRAFGDDSFVNGLLTLIDQSTLLEDNELLSGIVEKLAANPDEIICALVELCSPKEYSYSTIFDSSYSVSTVKYSDYWTKENAQYVSENLNGFVNNICQLLGTETLGDMLKELVGANLYTNENLTKIGLIFKDFIATLGDGSQKIFDLLGIDPTVWNSIQEDQTWGFDDGDKVSFINGLSTIISPLNPFLKLLFADEDFYLMNEQLNVLGYEGYKYGVIPILEALGCGADDIISGEQYLLDVAADESNLIKDIATPLFGLLEKVFDNPIDTLADMLPTLLYFIDSGAMSNSIKNALQAALVLIDTIRPVYDLDLDLDFDLNRIIENVFDALSIGSGEQVGGFTIPDNLDIASIIGGLVKTTASKNGDTRYYVESESHDTITALLRIVMDVVFNENNADTIAELVKKSANLSGDLLDMLTAVIGALNATYDEENGTDKILGMFYYIYYIAERYLAGDMTFLSDIINRWDYINETLADSQHDYILRFIQRLADDMRELRLQRENRADTTELEFWYEMPTGDMNMYSASSAEAFAQTRAAAFETLHNGESTQAEIDAAAQSLKTALYALSASNGVSYNGIYDAIVSTHALDNSQYSNFDIVEDAIDAVEITTAQTQANANAQRDAILSAIASLTYCCPELSVSLDTLIAEYAKKNKVDNTNYETVGELCVNVYNEHKDGCNEVHPYLADRYAQYESILAKYRAYLKTKGYDVFTTSTVTYPVRTVMENDFVRDKDYITDKEAFETVVSKIDNILTGEDFAKLLNLEDTLDGVVSDLISNNLYGDGVINTIVKAIYPTVWNLIVNAVNDYGVINVLDQDLDLRTIINKIADTMLSKYGICIYPDDLGDKLASIDSVTYSSVVTELKSAGNDWDAVNWDNMLWNVNDMDSWVTALGSSLAGAEPLILAVLCGKDYSHNETVFSAFDAVNVDLLLEATGINGYNNAVLPILEILAGDSVAYSYKGVSYTGLLPAGEYARINNINDAVAHIVYPILSLVENRLAVAPVRTIAEILPEIALSLQYDMLPEMLKSLSTSVRFAADIDVYGVVLDQSMDFNVYDMLNDESFGGLLKDADLTSINGIIDFVLNMTGSTLEIPEINNDYIAHLGTLVQKNSATTDGKAYRLNANAGDMLLELLRYVCALLGNEEFVNQLLDTMGQSDLLSENDILADVVKKLSENPDQIIAAVVELCCPVDYDYTTVFDGTYTVPEVTYSAYWTQAQADYVSGNLSGFADNICNMLGADTLGVMLEDLVGTNLYTNANLTSIALIFKDFIGTLGDSSDKLFEILGIDTTVWKNIDENTTWSFTDGDKDAFLDALAEILSPLNPFLKLVLADEDYSLLDMQITAKGYEGYNYGVIPILEALGCDEKDIVTGEKYLSDVAEDDANIIKDIVKPIFGLLEKVYENPVDTLMGMLPTLLYFIDSGAMSNSIKNTLQSILVLADTIRPVYDLDFDLDFDLTRIFENVLDAFSITAGDKEFKINLPATLNIASIIGGEVEKTTSKNGADRYYINADNSDVITSLLRIIVDVAFADGNPEAIAAIIKDSVDMDRDLLDMLLTVIDAFKMTYAEDSGTDKILSIFYYVYLIADKFLAGDMSFLSDIINRWDYINETISDSEHDYILRFIQTLADKLRELRAIRESRADTAELEYYYSLPVGETDMYTDATTFAGARATAFETLQNSDATQAEVDLAAQNLKNSILALETVSGVDYSKLYALLIEVHEMDEEQYSNFKLVTNAVKTVTVNGTQTQSDVNAMVDAVKAAIAALGYCCGEFSAILDELIAEYEKTNAVNASNYEMIGNLLNSVYAEKQDACDEIHPYLADRFAQYKDILSQYRAYLQSKGYDVFEESFVKYPVRKVLKNDVARDKNYITDKQAFDTVVTKIDNVIEGEDFANLIGLDKTLNGVVSDLITDNLYGDGVINAIVKAIYPTVMNLIINAVESYGVINVLDEDLDLRKIINTVAETMLSKYGICIYPDDLGDKLAKMNGTTYSAVVAELRNAGNDWNAVNWDNMVWNVNDMDSWVTALGSSLAGAEPLLLAVLCGKDYSHNETVISAFDAVNLDLLLEADGINGYGDALLPLLEILASDSVKYTYKGVSYTGLLSSTEYAKLDNINDAVAHIAYPILSTVENRLAVTPLRAISEILPELALCIEYDMIPEMLKALDTTVRFAADIDVYGVVIDQSIDFNAYYMLNDESFGGLLKNADLSSINGIIEFVLDLMGIDIDVPYIDNNFIAHLGTLEYVESSDSYRLDANAGDMLLTLLRYVCRCLNDDDFVNSILEAIEQEGLFDSNEFISQIITKLMNNPDQIIAAVVELCCPVKYDMSTLFTEQGITNKPITGVKYPTSYWTQAKATVVHENLDDFVNILLDMFGQDDNLGTIIKNLIGDNLYTNKNLTTIVLLLKDLIGSLGSGSEKILSILKIDLNQWNDIEEGHNWGFTDGDETAFINTIVDTLSPLNGLLKLVLANEDFSVLDSQITAKGYEGYKYGVLPILEALGCDRKDIVSGEQYLTDIAADEDNIIKDIVMPVLKLLEKVYEEPVDTVLTIIPNALYFIYTGAFSEAIKNTLKSVLVLVDTIRPVYDISLDLDFDMNAVICSYLGEFIEKYNLVIPGGFDFMDLIAGKAYKTSSLNGTDRYYVTADKANEVTILLRLALRVAFCDENYSSVKALVLEKSKIQGSERELIIAVLDNLKRVYNSADGTEKVLGIVYEAYTAVNAVYGGNFDDATVTELWKVVVSVFLKSENAYMLDFIMSVYDELSEVLKENLGFDIGTVVPKESLTFWQKIMAFIQKIKDWFANIFKIL